jgi:hypothetical protein
MEPEPRWQSGANMNESMKNCPGCNAEPCRQHMSGCDVERCSSCGDQRLQCDCADHDPLFARWTGFWPGYLESKALGIDMNELYGHGLDQVFFVKPKN